MKELDLEKAKAFISRVDDSTSSTEDLPVIAGFDISFLSVAKVDDLADSHQTLVHHFSDLKVKTFLRYRNEALFITEGNQDIVRGYILPATRIYPALPTLQDHYHILNAVSVENESQFVELIGKDS